MLEKTKSFIMKIINFIILHRNTIYLAIPFYVMDLVTRMHGYRVHFFPWYYPVPNIFTIVWIVLFVSIITSLKEITGKILYWILFIINFVLFMTHNIYYSFTGFYFNFNLLKMTDEGSSYIWDVIKNTNPLFYMVCLVVIIMAVIAFRLMPKIQKFNARRLIITIVFFLIVHTITPFLLGSANSDLQWNTFKNPRNTYENFNDCNKSMKVSGMYEYTVRNFYVTFLKPDDEISENDKTFLDEVYSAEDTKTANGYTGIFEGKNLIFLQLEGMDEWMLTKKTTPNLYALKSHSINFTKHYSIYTGGGSTFNSEFAVNTGFTTPLSYTENVYSFNTNTFDTTMAKLFKEKNYTVNAFHMNSKDFYSRGVNYQSWGYDKYYGLIDIEQYDDERYKLDRELILNKTFYNKMFKQSGNFVDYIITYSPHTPFTTEKGVGQMLAEEKYAGQEIPNLSEEDCALLAAEETDNMVGMLIQALKDNGLYENTVIVAYADHYLYTLEDKSILDKHKKTENNLINHTPFFIWADGLEYHNVKKVTMQTNILPTVLNLFGIDYNSNYFISKDALAKDYKGVAFFPDYSWYDGNVYVENNSITNKGKMKKKELNAMNEKVNNIIRQNDLTLKYDYFKPKD